MSETRDPPAAPFLRAEASYHPCLILTHFMGANRPAGQARRAARCGTSGKRRNAPGGPICPTRMGRALFVASGVARRLRCLAPRRNALLTGGKNRLGEMGQYQGGLVLDGTLETPPNAVF